MHFCHKLSQTDLISIHNVILLFFQIAEKLVGLQHSLVNPHVLQILIHLILLMMSNNFIEENEIQENSSMSK